MTDRAWRLYFHLQYRVIRLLDPLIRLAWRGPGPGLAPIIDLRVPGRRSGRPRRVLLTGLELAGRLYVGHPNGDTGWTRNLEAAASALIEDRRGERTTVAAFRLPPGDERTSVVVSTARLQPFPGNLVYRLARGHILRVGAYFRLEPRPDSVSPTS